MFVRNSSLKVIYIYTEMWYVVLVTPVLIYTAKFEMYCNVFRQLWYIYICLTTRLQRMPKFVYSRYRHDLFGGCMTEKNHTGWPTEDYTNVFMYRMFYRSSNARVMYSKCLLNTDIIYLFYFVFLNRVFFLCIPSNSTRKAH